jgi:sterol desaturase/sphingolipid hydroxylase (fatty acid hydroxylase superfamily)
LTYYVHRVFHTPPRPNLLSKSHKSYAHSITSPYPFTSTYDHPIPYILLRFVPLYLPTLIFRPHVLSYLILLAYTTLETTLTYSGYNIFPWIMLGGFQRRTDLHYQCHGKGNFAPWGFMDWAHGTSIGGDVVEDVMDEAGKHRVKERGSRAWISAQEGGMEGIKRWNKRRKSGKKG